MDTKSSGFDDTPARAEIDRFDRICDEFEAAWREGRRPQIEDAVHGAADIERSSLLRELLLLEVAYRTQEGEAPARMNIWSGSRRIWRRSTACSSG